MVSLSQVFLVAMAVTAIKPSDTTAKPSDTAAKPSGAEPTLNGEINRKINQTATDSFNPMDLYINQREGVSLAFEDQKQKFTYCHELQDIYACGGATFKSLADNAYTRILVGPSTGNQLYPLTFTIHNPANHRLYTRVENLRVHENNDGTVSLSCESNGKYMTWGNGQHNDGFWWSSWQSPLFPACLESGICPHCRFSLVVGSITDIHIRLVDLSWGDPEETIPSSPSQVAEDVTVNWSDEPINTRLKVVYKNTISDTTIWEHAWGFELKVEAKWETNIPMFGGGSVTTTATTSYNGKYGTQNTETDEETFENWKDVICAARTRCFLKFVASKLDNYDMPFTATVERNQDEGGMLQWQEKGVWRGVQAFNFQTVYCTESLDTGENNCPTFAWIEEEE